MTSETLRTRMPDTDNFPLKNQTLLAGIIRSVFSLTYHKLESDRQGKHDNWTTRKHIILTTFAILTDVGFNSGTIILVLTGHLWGAAALKSAHTFGSHILPEPITYLKNKVVNKQS